MRRTTRDDSLSRPMGGRGEGERALNCEVFLHRAGGGKAECGMTKRMSLLMTPAVTRTNERERMGRNESVLSCAPLRLLRKSGWWLAACLLAGGIVARSCSRNPLERAIDRLLTAPLTIWRAPPETFDNFGDRELALVLQSGTNCVPYLCQELRRRETAFNRFYLARWRILPSFLTRLLPEPVPVR